MRSFLLRSVGLESMARLIVGADLLVLAVAAGLAVLLDEHEDVVDVDLDLLDELDLEDDVVVDRLLLGVLRRGGTRRRGRGRRCGSPGLCAR